MTSLMKRYSVLIVAARKADRKKLKPEHPSYVYYENHHVWPVAFGKDDRPQNLVLLTFAEHVEAHVLLAKLYSWHYGLQQVPDYMLSIRGLPVSLEAATVAKELFIASASARWAGDRNPAKKPKNRKAQSDRFIDNNPGKKSKNRQASKDRWAGDKHPSKKPKNREASSRRLTKQNFQSHAEGNHPSQKPENREANRVRAKLLWESDSNPSKKPENREASRARGKIVWEGDKHPSKKPENQAAASKRMTSLNHERNGEQVQCSYCAKTGGRAGMQRHHFGNCLQHPDNLGLTRQQIKARRQT